MASAATQGAIGGSQTAALAFEDSSIDGWDILTSTLFAGGSAYASNGFINPANKFSLKQRGVWFVWCWINISIIFQHLFRHSAERTIGQSLYMGSVSTVGGLSMYGMYSSSAGRFPNPSIIPIKPTGILLELIMFGAVHLELRLHYHSGHMIG